MISVLDRQNAVELINETVTNEAKLKNACPYSRKIVHWEVYEEQTAENTSELIKKAKWKENLLSTHLLVLHSDNGGPMKGAVMLETLYKLGITPSRSRPRVSNDNAYAESIFKILKYRPNYQPEGFETIEEARTWLLHYEQGISRSITTVVLSISHLISVTTAKLRRF